jgi:hypothetical protein
MALQRRAQIFTEAHPRPRCGFTRRLTNLRVNALHAPVLRAAHVALATFELATGVLAEPRGDSRITHDFAVSIKGDRVLMPGKMVNGREK